MSTPPMPTSAASSQPPSPLSVDPRKTALLVMDVQRSIVDRFGGPTIVERVRRVAEAARRAGVLVGFVVVGFRPGFPEISPNNATFSAIRAQGAAWSDPTARAIHPDVAPQGEEWTVTKHRVGAFEATDLDMLLRSSGRDTLILTGIATSGVVLSTLRAAADKDYRVIVVEDACADMDPEVHRVLMTKVFARQATVVASDALKAALRSA
ncbi:MAG: cysteine hydrolase family protein [Thermoplasmatota archaeon]